MFPFPKLPNYPLLFTGGILRACAPWWVQGTDDPACQQRRGIDSLPKGVFFRALRISTKEKKHEVDVKYKRKREVQ